MQCPGMRQHNVTRLPGELDDPDRDSVDVVVVVHEALTARGLGSGSGELFEHGMMPHEAQPGSAKVATDLVGLGTDESRDQAV
jgi:hypothetical protein